jgi:hypothetical protein
MTGDYLTDILRLTVDELTGCGWLVGFLRQSEQRASNAPCSASVKRIWSSPWHPT